MGKRTLLVLISALVVAGPSAGDKSVREPERIRPPQLEEEIPDLVVVVKAVHNGHGITVVGPGDKKTSIQQEKWQGNFLRQLRALRKDLKNKDHIMIRGDASLRFALIVEILDICKQAGFKDVGFAPPPE